jgi:hypothetical protein
VRSEAQRPTNLEFIVIRRLRITRITIENLNLYARSCVSVTMYKESSTSDIADVMKKGSGTQIIVGIIVLIIGIGFRLSLKSVLITIFTFTANVKFQ